MWIIPLLLLSCVVTSMLAVDPEGIDPETCPPQMDIAFLLDTSGSTEEIYREHVNWTLNLIDALPVHKDAVRVTVIQYAESPIVEFHLGQYEEKGEILKHLEEMKFQSGVTKSGAALRAAEEQLFIESNGARRNVTKCVVIFTDGLSIDDPINPSYHLRNEKGVKIYVISIGITAFVPEMLQIAGEPENVFGPSDSERFKKQLLFDVENSRVCPQDLLIAREVASTQLNQTVDTVAITPITKFPVLISDPTFTIDYPDDDENESLLRPPGLVSENVTSKKVEPTTTKMTRQNSIFNGKPKTSSAASTIKNDNLSAETQIEVIQKPLLSTKTTEIKEKQQIVEPVKTVKVPAKVAHHALKLKNDKLTTVDLVEKDEPASKELAKQILEQTKIITNQTNPVVKTTLRSDQSKVQLPEKVRKVKKVRRIIRRLRKRKGANALSAKPLEGRRKIVRKVVHKSRSLGIQNTKIHNESIIPELPTGRRTVETVPLQTIRANGKFIKRPITPKKRQSVITHPVGKSEVSVEAITFPSLLTTLESSTKAKLTARPWINPNKLRSLASLTPPKPDAHPIELKPVQKTVQINVAKKILPVESTTNSVTVPVVPKTTSTKPVARQFAVKTTEVEKRNTCPLDILFIVDSSGSIQNIYDKQKTYISSLLQSIDPELKSHRVSLIQFSSAKTQKMEWTFDSYSQNEQLMKAFNGVRYFTGTTYIGAALKLALTELETRRDNVPTIVILVSDGFSQDDAIDYSNKINSLENVEFFVVSLATLNNNKYLGKMVESDANVYIGKDAEFFRAKLLERLQCN